MTREEAINKLNWALDNNTIEDIESAYEYIVAIKMAIKALQMEPFINKPCVSEQACREDKMKVLEKIKADIEAKCCITVGRECDGAITLHDIFEIIDKYKEESEG